jgi:hypothetical protein
MRTTIPKSVYPLAQTLSMHDSPRRARSRKRMITVNVSLSLRSPTENENGTSRESINSNTLTPIPPSPIEGEGSDPLLPSMGRTQEGCSKISSHPFSKEGTKITKVREEIKSPSFPNFVSFVCSFENMLLCGHRALTLPSPGKRARVMKRTILGALWIEKLPRPFRWERVG